MLLKLGLRNILRQRTRSAVTMLAIVFGVMGLILAGGFVQDIFIQLGEAVIHSQTGHVEVFRRDFLTRGTRQPEKFLIESPDALVAKIAAQPGVADVASRLYFAGLLNNGRRDLGIVGEGVEPEKESHVGTYIRISAGRQLTDKDSFGLLAGQGVADTLGLKPGDRVTLVMSTAGGALNSLDFELVGTFQSFSRDYDARAVRIPLAAAQELMASAGANVLVVRLHRTEDTDATLNHITALLDPQTLEARSWRQLSDFYDKTVELYDRQFGVLQLIILFMVLLSVVNSVNMSAFERQSEFGTLQALGNKPRDVFKLLMVENVILGLIGATLGVIVGVTAAKVISAIGIPMPPPPNSNLGYTAYIRIVPSVVALAFGIGFVATVLAALFPAWRTVRLPIVDALRQSI